MKYCKTDNNTKFKITYLKWMLFEFDNTDGGMKDIYDLMKSLLTNTFGYHGRLKRFVIAASYDQILFHKKACINEAIVELDVNRLYGTSMTTIKIPKGKPREIITNTGKVCVDEYYTTKQQIYC
jgi:hypothetical protein